MRTILYLIFIVSLLTVANANAASKRSFVCDGFVFAMTVPKDAPAFGTIYPEQGLWFEVPNMDISGDDERVFFLNTDNSKLALIGVGNTGQLYMQVFNSYEHFKAGKPANTLRCRKG